MAALELYGFYTKRRRFIAGTSLSSSIDLAVAPTRAGNAFGSGIVVRLHVDQSGLELYIIWGI